MVSITKTPKNSTTIFFKPLGSIWLEEWKNERIKNEKGIEKWEDRINLVFSCIWLGGWKSKKMKNLFVWLRKKNEMMENEVGINLQLYPPLNKIKK